MEKVKHPEEQQEKAPSELFTFLLNKQEAETSARLALEMKVREEQVAAAKNAKEEQAKADMVELAVYRRDALGLALGGDGIGSLGIIQQQQQAALVQQQQQQRLAFLQHQQHQQQLLLSFGHAHSAGGMFPPGMALQPPAHFALGCSSAGMLPQGLPQQHQVTLLQQQQQLPFGHAHSAGGMSLPGIALQQLASMQQPQAHFGLGCSSAGMPPQGLLQQHQAPLLQQQQQQLALLQQQQQQLLLPFGHAHSAGGMSQPGIASQQLASMQQPQEHLGMTSHGLLQHHQVTLLQQQQQQQHAGLASGPGINAGMLTQQTNTKAEQQPPM